MKIFSGFTLIEMMIVVMIIGILAAMAVPSYMFKAVAEQIEGAVPLIDIAKAPIASSWNYNQTFPVNNIQAGLPVANKMVNNYVSSVAIDHGAIHITFGNRASGVIKGKILTLRPAVVDDESVVPIAWVCADAEVPGNMTVKGVNKTTVPAKYLPLACRRKVQ